MIRFFPCSHALKLISLEVVLLRPLLWTLLHPTQSTCSSIPSAYWSDAISCLPLVPPLQTLLSLWSLTYLNPRSCQSILSTLLLSTIGWPPNFIATISMPFSLFPTRSFRTHLHSDWFPRLTSFVSLLCRFMRCFQFFTLSNWTVWQKSFLVLQFLSVVSCWKLRWSLAIPVSSPLLFDWSDASLRTSRCFCSLLPSWNFSSSCAFHIPPTSKSAFSKYCKLHKRYFLSHPYHFLSIWSPL